MPIPRQYPIVIKYRKRWKPHEAPSSARAYREAADTPLSEAYSTVRVVMADGMAREPV